MEENWKQFRQGRACEDGDKKGVCWRAGRNRGDGAGRVASVHWGWR